MIRKPLSENELMIGNWVSNDKDAVYQITNGWEMDEGMEVFGISLTEEWLLNFGFENDLVTMRKGKVMLGERKDGSYSVFYGTLTHGRIDECDIKYVHQLQNLFFVLSGKELLIKINKQNNTELGEQTDVEFY
jgi:hypothetical protein